MGLRAQIYLTLTDAHAALISGDMDEFLICEDRDPLDLDKTWHAIHFLVTGNSELKFLIGGVQLPDVEETCEFHAPDKISTLYKEIFETPVDTLLSKFSPSKFNELEIYPESWNDDGCDYIKPYLISFLSLLKIAVQQKLGTFVTIA